MVTYKEFFDFAAKQYIIFVTDNSEKHYYEYLMVWLDSYLEDDAIPLPDGFIFEGCLVTDNPL